MGFWANQLNHFDKGRWLVSNLQWIATLAILFKVYGLENYLIIGTVLLIVTTWMIGVVLIKSGLWDSFTRASNAGLKQWFVQKEE